MPRSLVFVLLPLALLGDARIFLFVFNRMVIGGNVEEKTPWRWFAALLAPTLLLLTALFWPLLHDPQWLSVGSVWLLIAATIGSYWILDRLHTLLRGEVPTWGVRTHEPEIIALRPKHIPFAFLQRLGAHNDVYDLEITHHEIFIADLPPAFDGYRIAFLTDTHVTTYGRRFLRECIARTNAFVPDLILLGGDFVTFHRHIELMAETLVADLVARDGIYAVLGNHDYWAGGEDVERAMTARGVQFIINRSLTLERDGARIDLVGIDEIYRGRPDLDAAFANVDPTRPCVGLTHHPDLIDRLGGRRIDLLLCGHTHGGQIRFPFFGSVVVPSMHEGRYAQGFHRVEGVLLYVSRGIGAIPPLRILCRPEIATFVLRRQQR